MIEVVSTLLILAAVLSTFGLLERRLDRLESRLEARLDRVEATIVRHLQWHIENQ